MWLAKSWPHKLWILIVFSLLKFFTCVSRFHSPWHLTQGYMSEGHIRSLCWHLNHLADIWITLCNAVYYKYYCQLLFILLLEVVDDVMPLLIGAASFSVLNFCPLRYLISLSMVSSLASNYLVFLFMHNILEIVASVHTNTIYTRHLWHSPFLLWPCVSSRNSMLLLLFHY